MNGVFSGIVWKFFEKTSAQIVSFVVSIVLARMLMPEEYGMIAMVSVFIVIADVFVSTGLSTALVQKKDSDELDFSSNFLLNLALSIVLYAILFGIAPLIANFYNNQALCPVLRVLGIRLIFAAYSAVQQAYISKYMLFKNTAIASIIATLISAAIGIYLAYADYGVWALVTQQLSLIIIQIIVLSLIVKWRPKFEFSWERSKSTLAYSSNVLIANLLDTVATQMRSLIIGKCYTEADLAYYNRGDSYPQMLLNSINNSLHIVLFAAYSKEQDRLDAVRDIIRKGIKRGTYLIFPMMTGLALVSRPLVLVLLTEKWEECIPYLCIACFTYATWVLQIVNQEAIIALGYAKDYLKVTIIRTVISLVLLVIAMKISVMAVAVSATVGNIASVIIVMWYVKKYIGYGYIDLFKDIFPALAISMIMAIPVFLLSFINVSNVILLVIQVLVGVLVYISISIVTRNESFLWMSNKVQTKFLNKKVN